MDMHFNEFRTIGSKDFLFMAALKCHHNEKGRRSAIPTKSRCPSCLQDTHSRFEQTGIGYLTIKYIPTFARPKVE